MIRQVKPERVITQSPERNWDSIFASHPDHLAAGEAAVCAVYPDARNPFAHPELLDDEGLEPWSVPELWIMGPAVQGVGIAVETTATCGAQGGRADVPQEPDRATPRGSRSGSTQWARSQGEAAGLPVGSSAELFRVTLIP